MLYHIFRSYRTIDEIHLKENAMKTMEPYDPSEPHCPPHQTPRKGAVIFKFRSKDYYQRHDGVQNGYPFGTNRNFQQLHKIKASSINRPQDLVNIRGIFPPIPQIATASSCNCSKWGYTAALQKIYDVPSLPPTEYHDDVIDPFHAITQGMQNQRYEMDGMVQSKYIPDQSQLCIYGAIGANNCRHGRDASSSQDPLVIIQGKTRQ